MLNYLAICGKEQYNNHDYTMKVGIYMNANEFDLDFDFEKEYGFDLPKEEPAAQADEDFDLRAILESDFNEEAALFNSEYENNFDYGPDEFPLEEEAPAAPEIPVDPDLSDIPGLSADDELDFSLDGLTDEVMDEPAADMPPVEEEPEKPLRQRRTKENTTRRNPLFQPRPAPEAPTPAPDANPRRKPVSKSRQFKNETMPLIIMGITALLIVVFVFGALGRTISSHLQNNEDNANASESQMNEEQRLALEAEKLLDEAALLAAGYDYDAAIAKLESFSGGTAKNSEITVRLSEYNQAKSTLIAHNDPGAVPNLSFHVLIADPARAFSNQQFGGKYNQNFVTVDEFQKILEQLYANGFVLVSMDDVISETVTGDTVTLSAKPLYLPDGKKPVMITETMVNYFNYMIDGDGDGTPDKDGAGFASRLVVDDITGQIKAEMVNSSGETVTGDYDLVPILEKFIEEHPDFSYRGARATLAVCGHEGVFGYRTNPSVVQSKSQEYYDEQVAGAKVIVNALKEKGYEIACYSYSNTGYSEMSATGIQAEMASWKTEVMPIVGNLDTIVYAQKSDISSTGNYTGGKYNVLKDTGFRYFISNGNQPSATVTSEYVRQLRIMVIGSQMYHTPTVYSDYFDARTVLNSQRGDVPQGG